MAILCCSQDDALLAKIVALYGDLSDNGVISRPDIGQLQENDLQLCSVLIVDLHCSALPDNVNCGTPVIALSSMPTFQEAVLLLQRGAKGYGNRHMRPDNLAQAVENVKAGQIWLPPAIITQLIASVNTDTTGQTDNNILSILSKREQEAALYVAEGLSNQEMADRMYVSLRTVKAHLSSIYDKTGLRNRLELGLSLKKNSVAV